MTADQREIAAVHEASHAVACLLGGASIRLITLVPGGRAVHGWTGHDWPGGTTIWAPMLAALAGPLSLPALRRTTTPLPWSLFGSDGADAQRLAALSDAPFTWLRHGLAAARQTVDEQWPAITELAGLLTEPANRGFLAGSQVHEWWTAEHEWRTSDGTPLCDRGGGAFPMRPHARGLSTVTWYPPHHAAGRVVTRHGWWTVHPGWTTSQDQIR